MIIQDYAYVGSRTTGKHKKTQMKVISKMYDKVRQSRKNVQKYYDAEQYYTSKEGLTNIVIMPFPG